MGELRYLDAILPILVRLELPLPVNTAAILQRAALLWARPPPYTAVGGGTACSGVILPIFVRLVLSVPMGTATIMQRAALL